jgi:hypothetical protein
VPRSGSVRVLAVMQRPLPRTWGTGRAWLLPIALACWLGPRLAGAQELDFSLRYGVPTGCPPAAWFTEAVQARRQTSPNGAEQRAALTVTLLGDDAQAQGTLEIALPGGQSAVRTMPPASCPDVLTSMAIVAAMVLDGRDLDAGPAFTNPVSQPPATTPTPRSVALSRQPASQPRPEPARSSAAWQPGLAGGLGPMNAIAPTPTWVFALGGELRLATRRVFAPRLRLSGAFGSNSHSVTPAGTAHFRLVAVDARACPIGIPAGVILRFAPCAELQVGDLRGTAQSTQHMPWVALGVGVRFESWVHSRFALELEPSVARLWRNDRFVVQPGLWSYDVPAVSFGLRFGVLVSVK